MHSKSLQYKIDAGAARVLNGVKVIQDISLRRQETQAQEPPRLMFKHMRLNRAIYLKDTLAVGNQSDRKSPGSIIATKLLWPYDDQDVYAGGETIFLRDPLFESAIQRKLGIQNLRNSPEWASDKHVFQILEQLPSFDPFLLKDRFQIEGIPLEPEYFNIAEAEWIAVRRYLREKIAPMINLAFKEMNIDSAAKVDQFIDKIWVGSDVNDLAPLIKAFRLPVENTQEILNGWKGVAYFEKQYQGSKGSFVLFAEWITKDARPMDFPPVDIREELNQYREAVRVLYAETWKECISIFTEYNKSYEALLGAQHEPAGFIKFINQSSDHFWTLGSNLTKLYNAIDIWNIYTERAASRKLRFMQLLELLAALKETLSH